MSIDIRRHRDITMPHDFLHHLQRYPHTHQQRHRAMPQVMKTHMRKTCLSQRLIEQLQEVHRTHIPSMPIREHQVTIMPGITSLYSCLLLPITVLFQHTRQKERQCDHSSSCCCFRFGLDIPMPSHMIHSSTYIDPSALEIDISPL